MFDNGADTRARAIKMVVTSLAPIQELDARQDRLGADRTVSCAVRTSDKTPDHPAPATDLDNITGLFPMDDVFDAEQSIARLAGLSVVAYEQCRTAEATRLKMRVGALDQAVAAKRPRSAEHGRGVVLHDPEPWSEQVATAPVLDALVAAINRHVILPPMRLLSSRFWVAHPWAFHLFEHSPRLAIS